MQKKDGTVFEGLLIASPSIPHPQVNPKIGVYIVLLKVVGINFFAMIQPS